MSDYEVCDTGLWVDADGNVVDKAPDGPGRQLVPPGGQMRPDRVKAVEAARAEAPQQHPAEGVTDPEPAKPAKAPAKKAAAKG